MKKKIKLMIKVELLIVVLLLIVFMVVKTGLVYLMPPCIINSTFGILCPSCQGTRCVMNFVHGNFLESFLYHPIFFITIIYLFLVNILFIVNSFRKKEILTFLYPKTKFWLGYTVIILIFTVCRNIW
ncbi:MAG: DUF2752 domain-containing protein [Clostridia bacterium]|nr:DUF2752 domain-containing protein [Clostridia bacterium]